jgi:DNA-binding NarL/FixJ family response regulator
MSPGQWQRFLKDLTPPQVKLIALKQQGCNNTEISNILNCTPKQAQKRWTKLLDLAWQHRNQE